jgi:spermidine synthase
LLRGAAAAYASLPANSDYLPILGLNAPKTRFQSSTASAHFSLPYLNGNLLAAMGIRQPFPDHLEPPLVSNFLADQATKRARSLVQELKEPATSGAFHEVAMLKIMSGPNCRAFQQDRAARMRWGNLVRLTFEATQPFLTADQMRGAWIEPAWQRCNAIGPDFERVLALLASHARRDYAAMERLGRDWLDTKPQKDTFLSNEFDPVAASGLLLSLVHTERWDDLNAALKKYPFNVPKDSEYRYQHDLIAGIAKSQKNPSSGK